MTREEQLELALWAVLSLVDQGVTDAHGRRITRGMVPVDQGWRVLGEVARRRIEGEADSAAGV